MAKRRERREKTTALPAARAAVALAMAVTAAGAMPGCRHTQPGSDPRPTPNSPIPDVDRPKEGSPGSASSNDEGSAPPGARGWRAQSSAELGPRADAGS